jgi:hypothetical protein
MKIVTIDQIREAIAELCQRANLELATDVRGALLAGLERETAPLAKSTLRHILRNAEVARERRLPLCRIRASSWSSRRSGRTFTSRAGRCARPSTPGFKKELALDSFGLR